MNGGFNASGLNCDCVLNMYDGFNASGLNCDCVLNMYDGFNTSGVNCNIKYHRILIVKETRTFIASIMYC